MADGQHDRGGLGQAGRHPDVLRARRRPALRHLLQSGILATRTAHDAQGPVKRITRAGVVLDANPDPTSGALELRSWSLMHELAASLGLGAVTDGNQKMSEIIPNAAVDTYWGAGDLAGLNRIGLVEGCVTDGRR